MKIRVERDVLAEAVTWVARGLPNRPPVPVLAGVLITADEAGTLTLSAFDYETSARIIVPADVSEPGTVLVLGRLLADISRNLPMRPIEITTEGNKVQLTCGSSRFSLLQMPSDEYPSLPISPDPSGSVAGNLFTQAVAQVSIAADKSDTLPILTGVRVEIEGSKMTLLATDRYRLAMRELDWNPRDPEAAGVLLVPARTLSETAKSLGAAASVEIAFGEAAGGDGLIGFEAGQRRTTSRLLDGEYPKVSSIFPSSAETEAVVETSALVEAVKRVSLVAERNTPVRLRFAEGQLSIDAGTGDDAQASEAIECSLSGEDFEIAFNPHYLLDGLHAIGTDHARLAFTQSNKPAVLSGQSSADGEADSSYRYVLMPVRFAG
ncbi:DNA polymerase-3 subunit beta [Austwickia chelonae]|uniref:Beta sliding clamp n=1 Tax=Austwickia chelonae NBRC 105200 TaxID=1184607 RepID=K6VUS7_9MICO|nr:DNA polymerase III subunit beta [Austwickia chelonae]GAB79070.1 DNA polymerase III beta subunit [Austwickia chelonae NBRC 105200]SEW42041.1 DNA polymerase-3 subunit beta [Austwickia chelonae]